MVSPSIALEEQRKACEQLERQLKQAFDEQIKRYQLENDSLRQSLEAERCARADEQERCKNRLLESDHESKMIAEALRQLQLQSLLPLELVTLANHLFKDLWHRT